MPQSPSLAAGPRPASARVATGQGGHARGLLLVFVAGLLYASAGLFTRALHFDAWTLLAWRSLAGGATMMVLIAVESGRLSWRDYAMGVPYWALVPCGAAATISYIVALKLTTVADVMIVYATTPFVTAAIAWVWIGEAPSRRLVIASSLSLVGVGVMIGGGGGPAHARLVGAGLILLMNLCFGAMLVLARRSPGTSMLPMNALALLLASAVSFAVAPHATIEPGPLAMMMLFGILTVGLAMALFMAGARRAPAAEVALIGISDVVIGPVMVYVVFGEDPGTSAIAGGVIVVAALLWNIWPELRRAMRGDGGIPT